VWPICLGIGALAAYGLSWLPRRDHGRTQAPPEAITELFTPLQIEAFQLAQDLKLFRKTLTPYPDGDRALLRPGEITPEYIASLSSQRRAWHDRVWHMYAGEGFPDRVTALANKAGAKGIDVRDLEPFSRVVVSDEHVVGAVNALYRIALQLGDL
jgi:hypothetical protein